MVVHAVWVDTNTPTDAINPKYSRGVETVLPGPWAAGKDDDDGCAAGSGNAGVLLMAACLVWGLLAGCGA